MYAKRLAEQITAGALLLPAAADIAFGKRYVLRLDPQYGHATSTLQGVAVNELRPAVYQNIYQAYGTYVFPVARGFPVKFGKCSSSHAMESNYTKVQMSYSRSFW